MNVPLIDLSFFGDDNNTSSEEDQKKKVALELRDACENVGFFYIKGHGCPQAVLDAMMDYTKRFFDLPENAKSELEARNNPLWRGYNSVETGAHSCTPEDAAEHPPDLKESFTIGAEESASAQTSPMHGPNQWPSEAKHASLVGFEKATRQYWDSMHHTVGVRLLQALAMSLDLPADFFTSKIKKNPHSQMVLLRYPPAPAVADVATSDEKNQDDNNDNKKCNIIRRRGCGAHTDCGFVTILLQDSKGLEVQRSDGTWVSAPPLEEEDHCISSSSLSLSSSLVVNLGDLMAHWTNDRYQSTPHRVTNPSVTKARHSIPFFLAVDYDTTVEAIPSCRNHGQGKFYESCQSGEYILKKLGLMHLAKDAAAAGNVR